MALGSTTGMRLSFLHEFENGQNKRLQICLALTIGFLWLKVLGLAKTLNVQLATFVLAIIQVRKLHLITVFWFTPLQFAAFQFTDYERYSMVPPYFSDHSYMFCTNVSRDSCAT